MAICDKIRSLKSLSHLLLKPPNDPLLQEAAISFCIPSPSWKLLESLVMDQPNSNIMCMYKIMKFLGAFERL